MRHGIGMLWIVLQLGIAASAAGVMGPVPHSADTQEKIVPGGTAQTSTRNVLYSFDFIHGKGILELENDQDTPYAYGETTAPVTGEKAARFEVRKDGPNDGSSQRSELKIYRKDWHAEMHHEYWYGFKMLLPGAGADVWQPGGDRWCILAQWHDIPDGIDTQPLEPWRHPVLSLAAINGKWKILYRFDPDKTSDLSDEEAWDRKVLGNPVDPYAWQGQIDQPDPQHWYECPIDIGKWVKWVFRVKWEYDNTGILEVWKDDVKVISRLVNPIGYNDDEGPTCKFGIYRNKPGEIPGVQTNDRVAYVNKYIVGDSQCTYQTLSDFIGTTQMPASLVGAWPGWGVWQKNSASGAWQQISPLDPIQIATGDLDGDLKDDLLGWWDNGLWIRFHTGAWQKIEVNGSDLMGIGVADINGDEIKDVVVLMKNTNPGIWWRNSVDGSWGSLGDTTRVSRMILGHFDSDALEDIVVVLDSGDVWVRYAVKGRWECLSNSPGLTSIAAADYNCDGRDELLGNWSHGIWCYDFSLKTWSRIHDSAEVVAVADINGLGKADLIGVWPGISGVWVLYTETGVWEKLAATSASCLSAVK